MSYPANIDSRYYLNLRPAEAQVGAKTAVTRGGYSQKNRVGVCGPLPKTLTLFMTKICDFPYPIYDQTKNLIPYFVKGFCCLYFLAYKAAGGEEGKARMEGG